MSIRRASGPPIPCPDRGPRGFGRRSLALFRQFRSGLPICLADWRAAARARPENAAWHSREGLPVTRRLALGGRDRKGPARAWPALTSSRGSRGASGRPEEASIGIVDDIRDADPSRKRPRAAAPSSTRRPCRRSGARAQGPPRRRHQHRRPGIADRSRAKARAGPSCPRPSFAVGPTGVSLG